MKKFYNQERELTKKSGVDYNNRAKADLQYIRYASSYMQCDKCKEFLGILHCVRSALFKTRGKEYIITCKRCHYQNIRIKGALNAELSDRWKAIDTEKR